MAKSPRFPPSFAQRITWLGTMKNIPVRRVRSLVAAAHSHNCAHTCNISKPKSTGGYFAFSASPCLASCFLIVWFCSFGQVFFLLLLDACFCFGWVGTLAAFLNGRSHAFKRQLFIIFAFCPFPSTQIVILIEQIEHLWLHGALRWIGLTGSIAEWELIAM